MREVELGPMIMAAAKGTPTETAVSPNPDLMCMMVSLSPTTPAAPEEKRKSNEGKSEEEENVEVRVMRKNMRKTKNWREKEGERGASGIGSECKRCDSGGGKARD